MAALLALRDPSHILPVTLTAPALPRLRPSVGSCCWDASPLHSWLWSPSFLSLQGQARDVVLFPETTWEAPVSLLQSGQDFGAADMSLQGLTERPDSADTFHV